MSSQPLVVAVVLAAAFLHAGWNAVAKATPDRIGLLTRAYLVSIGVGAVLALFVAVPAAAAWPWLIGSVAVHIAYNFGLTAAYRVGDFNQTYPLARGVGPLVVALLAAVLLDEPLPPLPMVGVLVIAAAIGVLGLTPARRLAHNRSAVLAAVLTGLAIAGYTMLDGIGVRRSGTAPGYAVWQLSLRAAATAAAGVAVRRTAWARGEADRPARWAPAVAVSGMSMLAYGLVLWAQARGALAAVAALRESSVVVGAAIGVLLFKEPLGRVRAAASVAVAAGVVLLALA